MLGNASEWVIDEYDEAWYSKLHGRVFNAHETIRWPTQLYPRVLRGGSINSTADDCRSAVRRASNDEDLRSYDPNTPKSPWWFASDEALDIGFRIVRPLKSISREDQEKYWQADVRSINRDVNKRIFEEADRAQVLGVEPGSAAESAGIKQNDVITKLDGKEIKDFGELTGLIAQHEPGDSVTISVIRTRENALPEELDLKVTFAQWGKGGAGTKRGLNGGQVQNVAPTSEPGNLRLDRR